MYGMHASVSSKSTIPIDAIEKAEKSYDKCATYSGKLHTCAYGNDKHHFGLCLRFADVQADLNKAWGCKKGKKEEGLALCNGISAQPDCLVAVQGLCQRETQY